MAIESASALNRQTEMVSLSKLRLTKSENQDAAAQRQIVTDDNQYIRNKARIQDNVEQRQFEVDRDNQFIRTRDRNQDIVEQRRVDMARDIDVQYTKSLDQAAILRRADLARDLDVQYTKSRDETAATERKADDARAIQSQDDARTLRRGSMVDRWA